MKISKIAASLLLATTMSSLLITSVQAADSSNYSVAVELARTTKAKALANNINQINNYIKMYMFQTGDIAPTISKINTFFGIDANAWKNYNGNIMTLAIDADKITISNVFTTPPSKIVSEAFKNSTNLPTFTAYTADLKTLSIPYTANEMTFYSLTKKLQADPKIVVSPNIPTDITKIWYQPTGNGAYNIERYDTTQNKWVSLGTTGNSSGGSGGSGGIVVKSTAALNNLPATTGLKAMVSNGKTAQGYVYDGSKWVKTATAGSGAGQMYDGLGTIYDMATQLFSKAGGSKVTASAISGEWAGSKQFIKKDDAATGGYWMSTDGNFVVTKSFTNLIKLNNYFHNGITAWINNANGGVYKLKKMIIPGYGTHWAFQAANYGDVLNFVSAHALVTPSNSNEIVYVKNHNVFEVYNAAQNVFKPLTGNTFISKSNNGRNAFYPSSGKTYLLQNNDCTINTCNGTSANNYYAGAKTDGLYTFYYATTGKRKNNLIDAIPRSSIADAYNHNDSAAIVSNAVYLKSLDNKNRTCYKKTNGQYVTKGGQVIPTGNNLPYAKTCSTASYSGIYLNLDNRTEATQWTDAPNGAGIRIGSTNYAHKLYSGKDFWTNNGYGDGQQHASEIFTRGNRGNFPNITHNLTALSKQLGNQPRYTTNGVTSSIDNSFKQWFYATSGTRTNSLLDAMKCNANDGAANVDDICHNINVEMMMAGGQLYHNYNDYISKHTKYCYMSNVIEYPRIKTFSKWSNRYVYLNPRTHMNDWIKSGNKYRYADKKAYFGLNGSNGAVWNWYAASTGYGDSLSSPQWIEIGWFDNSHYYDGFKNSSCSAYGSKTWYK